MKRATKNEARMSLNFRCGQCGTQWSSALKRKSCGDCGSRVIQTVRSDEARTILPKATQRIAALIQELNRDTGSESLRAYANSWLDSDRNGFVWRQRYPDLFKSIEETLRGSSLIIVPAVDGCFLTWDYRDAPNTKVEKEQRRVDKAFADFLNESASKLGRCAGCQAFFEITPRRTKYCDSGRCATRVSSRAPKKAAHHNTHHDRFVWLEELLKKLADEAKRRGTSWPLSENEWAERVVDISAEHAQKVLENKARLRAMGRSLSVRDRRYVNKITRRWINDKLQNPECPVCKDHVQNVKQILRPHSTRKA